MGAGSIDAIELVMLANLLIVFCRADNLSDAAGCAQRPVGAHTDVWRPGAKGDGPAWNVR